MAETEAIETATESVKGIVTMAMADQERMTQEREPTKAVDTIKIHESFEGIKHNYELLHLVCAVGFRSFRPFPFPHHQG
jgi:hypothetical protein